MPDSYQDSNLAHAREVMSKALAIISKFPASYKPSELQAPAVKSGSEAYLQGIDFAEILSNPVVKRWLHKTMDDWPPEMVPTFRWASGTLGQILEMFGATQQGILLGALSDTDSESFRLLGLLTQLHQETKAEDGTKSDPMGMQKAIQNELFRRQMKRRTPFAQILTTLLGDDALLWLTSPSSYGPSNIQPHEFSRSGWWRLWSIQGQLEIEEELLEVPPDVQYVAKIVVALSWTLVALASFLPPAVFLGETVPHLSSNRQQQLTVSVGLATHTLISFESARMAPMLHILSRALEDSLLSAADMMWMAAALVQIREIQTGHAPAIRQDDDKFALFLSHRGRDAKRLLSAKVQGLQTNHGIFLDCHTLPRGIINRSFIYRALAQSETIIIVETENYNESEWCRKEAWFADEIAAQGLSKVNRETLADAAAQIVVAGRASSRHRPSNYSTYPIAPRVLKDIDYWGRQPNLYTLREAGQSTKCLAPLEELFARKARPDDSKWIASLGNCVNKTLSAVITQSPSAEVPDLWATALQLSMAAFASTSNAHSKMDVRRGVDQLITLLEALIAAELHSHSVFKRNPAEHLALLAAASAIDLAGFALDQRMIPAVRVSVKNTAGLRDGLLLLDCREPGDVRLFRLKLLAILVRCNLGSVGLVQDSDDQIHQTQIDGLPLEVLPCVTLYPGMDSPF